MARHTAELQINTLPNQIAAWFHGQAAFAVSPDGSVTGVSWGTGKPMLEQMQAVVHGYIEPLPCRISRWRCFGDEEGRSKPGARVNLLATMICGQPVVGTIIFTRYV